MIILENPSFHLSEGGGNIIDLLNKSIDNYYKSVFLDTKGVREFVFEDKSSVTAKFGDILIIKDGKFFQDLEYLK